MCELYLHSSRTSTVEHPFLAEFLDRSRKPHDNPDGWGLAFHHGDDAQLLHEAVPAHKSALARHMEAHPPEVRTLVGHIRLASKGGVRLSNTQPLSRIAAGKRLVFAHNGSVADLKTSARGRALTERALGTADSEIALLAFLDWSAGRSVRDCVPDFAAFALDMCAHGPFNVIITDGENVIAHSDRRHHTGDAPGKMRGPGLVMQKGKGGVVLASEPFSGEWEELEQGTTVHIRTGEVIGRVVEAC